jgi:hypothetical protein
VILKDFMSIILKFIKMRNVKISLLLLIVLTLIFSSCSQRVLDFTMISTKKVDLSKAASFERAKQRVKGGDMVHWIIFVPTGTVSIKEAVDKAIETTPGCVALLDGVAYTKFWMIPYIYGQQSVILEGTPLIDPSLVANLDNIPNYGKIEINRNGKIKSVEKISSFEYLALKERFKRKNKKLFGDTITSP